MTCLYLFGLNELLPVVVDCRRLGHEARDLPPNLVNAGLELSVDLVRCRALLAEVVNLALETGVPVHDFTVPDKQLQFTIGKYKGLLF